MRRRFTAADEPKGWRGTWRPRRKALMIDVAKAREYRMYLWEWLGRVVVETGSKRQRGGMAVPLPCLREVHYLPLSSELLRLSVVRRQT